MCPEEVKDNHIDYTDKGKDYINDSPILSEHLFQRVLYRSIISGIMLGFFVPVSMMELFHHLYTWDYVIKLFVLAVIIAPMAGCLIFFGMRWRYKCPRCKKFWAYQKVGEKIISVVFTQEGNNKTMRNERYLEEYVCSECGYKNFYNKNRKFIEK